MWTISELKQRGKAAFRANYWTAVVAGLILTASTSSEITTRVRDVSQTVQEGGFPPQAQAVVLTAVSIGGLLGMLIKIFGFSPLEVGGRRFFLVNSVSKASLGEFAWGFKNQYLNVVKTMFLRWLFHFLWTLLFIIPGFIKFYSYSMVPYIMAEDPGMDSMQAITLSRKLMDGEKMNKFMLDLSFIGWFLLSLCTCGLVGFLYLAPYKAATDAEFYTVVRGKTVS